MLTVVINNPYIRNGCRDGYVFWSVDTMTPDRSWANVNLPDYDTPTRSVFSATITERGTVHVCIPVQVVHGNVLGVFLSPSVANLPQYVRDALTPSHLTGIHEACEKGCEGDYPQPPTDVDNDNPVAVAAEINARLVAAGKLPLS